MKLLIEFDLTAGSSLRKGEALIQEVQSVMEVIYDAMREDVHEGTLLDSNQTPFGTWDLVSDHMFSSTMWNGNEFKPIDTVSAPILQTPSNFPHFNLGT